MAEFSDDALKGTIDFLTRAGALKDTLRSGHTDAGKRESTAEHSWRLALWVIALEPYLPGYDIQMMLKMATLHDLGEAITGDVPAIEQHGDQSARQAMERQAVADLTGHLDKGLGERIQEVASSYDAGRSKEAALMKGLDKLETMLQHCTAEDPTTFDYEFNLSYGTVWTRYHPLLVKLRAHIDAMTRARMAQGV